MQCNPRWKVDATGDIIDIATGKVVWFKTGVPTDGLPDLVANAPEMLELFRDAVMMMQFTQKLDRDLSELEKVWLDKATYVLALVEGWNK